jgi:hypothetical protein
VTLSLFDVMRRARETYLARSFDESLPSLRELGPDWRELFLHAARGDESLAADAVELLVRGLSMPEQVRKMLDLAHAEVPPELRFLSALSLFEMEVDGKAPVEVSALLGKGCVLAQAQAEAA